MSERTLIPIFIFWAFLTIITPTLVLLSENSKPDFDLYGNSTEVAPPWTTVAAAEELAPAPAQALIVSLPTGANLTAVGGHNGSVASNKSDDGLAQVFPRKHLKQMKLPSTQLASS
ncbi:uncharacterized protein LOC114747888 [Neltuma alba]|uniref:uncharacterized protein LOC114747888 n=1 Tax=Neltuma alba TaxID=207710 RepID=UPI0010A4785A|nr:uncharacterized protein LOC114747888 [Prosopis alba]